MFTKDKYLVGLEKTASLPSYKTIRTSTKAFSNVAKDISSTFPVVGLLALNAFGIKAIINKIQNDTRRKALIEDLMSTDPIIKEEDSAKVLEYYATLYNIAPTISLEKSVVRELLQHFVKFGRIDLATIKTLAETEEKTTSSHRNKTSVKDILKM